MTEKKHLSRVLNTYKIHRHISIITSSYFNGKKLHQTTPPVPNTTTYRSTTTNELHQLHETKLTTLNLTN